MFERIDKPKENKSKAIANNTISQKQIRGRSTFQFVDDRPEVIAKRKQREMIEHSIEARKCTQLLAKLSKRAEQHQGPLQKKHENSAGLTEALDIGIENQSSVTRIETLNTDKQPSEKIKARLETDQNVIQRAIDVIANGENTKDVSIKASGEVEDFEDGDDAGTHGWNNVTSYSGRVYIYQSYYKRRRDGSKKWYERRRTVRAGPYDNDFRVAQAGHILARQNGGYGSDPENVFAQDGGVNNGPWRTNFENPMRRWLNKCYLDDRVDFRVGLHGKVSITKGPLVKISSDLEADDQSIFDTTDESDSGSDSD